MSDYIYNRNPDNVFLRALILACRNLLHNKIVIKNHFKKTGIKKVKIPFFYDVGNDERFMQDVYLSSLFDDLIIDKPIEGNIDQIPRGMYKISGVSINSGEASSRFIPGKRIVLAEDGTLKTQYSQVNLIPLNVTFDVEIILSTKIDMFKIWQEIVKTLYRGHHIGFIFENNYVPGYVTFSEDYGMEKTSEFSYGDKQTGQITFNFEVRTYFPVYDEDYFVYDRNERLEKFELNFDVTNKIIEELTPEQKEEFVGFYNSEYNDGLSDPTNQNIDFFKPDDMIDTPDYKDEFPNADNFASYDLDTPILPFDSMESMSLGSFLDQDHNLHFFENFGIKTRKLRFNLELPVHKGWSFF